MEVNVCAVCLQCVTDLPACNQTCCCSSAISIVRRERKGGGGGFSYHILSYLDNQPTCKYIGPISAAGKLYSCSCIYTLQHFFRRMREGNWAGNLKCFFEPVPFSFWQWCKKKLSEYFFRNTWPWYFQLDILQAPIYLFEKVLTMIWTTIYVLPVWLWDYNNKFGPRVIWCFSACRALKILYNHKKNKKHIP